MAVTKDPHGPADLATVEQALWLAFGQPAAVPDGVELRTDHGPRYTGADRDALVNRWRLDPSAREVKLLAASAVG